MNPIFHPAESILPPGLSVIEASAGTGKTYSLSHLVPRLLLEGSASRLGEILLVTFTNDAAAELADRIRRVIEQLASEPEPNEEGVPAAIRNKFLGPENPAGQKILEKASREMDQLSVSTIHSFCQRILQLEGPLCGWPVSPELIPDTAEVLQEILYREWVERLAGDPLLAGVAEIDRWSLAEDTRFFQLFVEKDELQAEPPAQGLADSLARLSGYLEEITFEKASGMISLLEPFETYRATVSRPSEGEWGDLKKMLQSSSRAPVESLRLALTFVDAPGWVNKKSKEGRERSKGLEADPFCQLCRNIKAHLPQIRWSYRNHLLGEGRQSFENYLRDHRLVTYEGLIATIRDTLEGPRGDVLRERLRDRFKVALIDESQDTDPRQFSIFSNIFLKEESTSKTPHRLVLIGDPKQAIYAFRGADVNTYLAAVEEAEEVFSLTTTYRAPPSLVNCVNALFQRKNSFLKEGLFFTEAESGLSGDLYLDDPACSGKRVRAQAWVVSDEDADAYRNQKMRNSLIARQVAGEIQRLIHSAATLVDEGRGVRRPVKPGDFAVLVSSHREGEAVAAALLDRGVPCLRAKLGDILGSFEAGEVVALLRAMLHPQRQTARTGALATMAMGFSAKDLWELKEDSEEETKWLNRFTNASLLWREKGVAAALQNLLLESQAYERLAALPEGERALVNWRQILDLLQNASTDHQKPETLLRWMVTERQAVLAGRSREEREILLETDEEAVQIVTMHSAKGLEYPFVFCPFLWPSVVPSGKEVRSFRADDNKQILVDLSLSENPAFLAQLTKESIEDRLRLIYVAITRARVKVWIFAGNLQNRGKSGQPSALDWLLRTDPAVSFAHWWDLGLLQNPGEAHRKVLETLIRENHVEESFDLSTPPALEEVTAPVENPERITNYTKDLENSSRPFVPVPWGLTSFSSLTREKVPHGLSGPEAVGGAERSEQEGNPFLLSPGGTGVGSAVHDWVENWDFSSPPDYRKLQKHLQKYPLLGYSSEEVEAFPRQVHEMLLQLRESLLTPWSCTISDACPRADLSEWDFQLPLRKPLRPDVLADLARRHGEPDYAPYLETLPLPDVTGFLNGFIDRIAYWDGNYGVIDWKTNNLGSDLASYRGEGLRRSVMESHYLLQSWLYLIALRRYLGHRKSITGAWVVYLRGISPGTDRGILPVLPKTSLLDELEEYF
ncbi:MAG: UvrD-helicase domain-containing protein [Opitutales bacterium]|nr:UvrD-helicase domain-containing protein [Opitutales bacterium]